MPVVDLKARSLEIQKNNLIKQLQKLLSQLENPNMTQEQLEKIKSELAACQEKYKALGF